MHSTYDTWPKRGLILLAAALLLSGCSWFSSSKDPTDPMSYTDDEKSARPSGFRKDSNMVLYRLGAKNPTFNSRSRDSWLQLRKTGKTPYAKLEAAAALGDWEKTVIEARLFLRDNPKNQGALKLLATGLMMRRSFEMALYYAKVYDQFYQGDSDIYNLMGLCYLYLKTEQFHNFKTAIYWLETAMEKSDDQIAAGLNLGYLYLETGNFYKATDVFSTTSQRCGDCPKAKLGYGVSLLRTNRYKEAKRVFEEVLADNPYNGTALFKLALVEKNGFSNFEAAKTHLNRLINSQRIKNATLKRRANFLLRTLEGGV